MSVLIKNTSEVKKNIDTLGNPTRNFMWCFI